VNRKANGKPDPVAAERDIREPFGRMAMNDEETWRLLPAAHVRKAHGAADPSQYVRAEPEGGDIEDQGFGWQNRPLAAAMARRRSPAG